MTDEAGRPGALIAAHIEELILDGGPAEHAAEAMRLIAGFRRHRHELTGARIDAAAGFVLKVSSRVQRGVRRLPEAFAVVVVGPALGLDQEHRARSASEFG